MQPGEPTHRSVAGQAETGQACPYCHYPLKEGVATRRCDACNSLHHEDCWRDGGGCAVSGCANAGRAAAAVPQAGPPAPAGPAYPQAAPIAPPTQATQAHAGYGGYPLPQAAPPQPRSGNQAVLIVAVAVALLGVGTGVAVATGAFSSSTRANTPAPSVAATNTTPQTQAAPVGPSASERASDRRAIVGILNTYQSGYSDHNISALASIFTPEIDRHGLAAGGCAVSRGRRAVLASYQSQFAEGSGSYELVGLSEGQIQLDGAARAHLDAHYRITPGGTGYINFKFAELGDGWKVSEVYATCE
jgi:hypothetical protein